MKKFSLFRVICLLLTISMLAMCFTGCKEEDLTTEEVNTEVLQTLYAENASVVSAAAVSTDITDYIYEWARGNDNYKVSYDSFNNVIVSCVATSDEYKEADSTILQCTIDMATPERTALALTAIMYILDNSTEHGFIRALFLQPDSGIEKVKYAYLSADNFISLDWSKNNNIMLGSAGRHDFSITKPITYSEASYPNAYEITIMGIEPTGAQKTNQFNAVKTLGKIMAELKSAGALLEIASFNSGKMDSDGNFIVCENEDNGYPLGAKLVVLVNDNDINKLTKKITKSQNSTFDKYLEANPNLVYDFVELEDNSVESVISSDDTSTLISFIYTSLYGVYDKDEQGEPIAVNNIISCNTDNDEFNVQLSAFSLSDSKMKTLDTTIETLCGLYDLSYELNEVSKVWSLDDEDNPGVYLELPLVKMISSAAYDIYEKETQFASGFENTSCARVTERVPESNIIAYGITQKNLERQTAVLLTTLERMLPTVSQQ